MSPLGQGSIFPYVSVVDTAAGEERRRKRIPMDGFFNVLVTSNPWETAISPDGKQAFVVFGGTNDMFACTVIDDDYRELGYSKYLQLGANPRAVRVAPDGFEYWRKVKTTSALTTLFASRAPSAPISNSATPLSSFGGSSLKI